MQQREDAGGRGLGGRRLASRIGTGRSMKRSPASLSETAPGGAPAFAAPPVLSVEREFESAFGGSLGEAEEQPYPARFGRRVPLEPAVGDGYRDLIRLPNNLQLVVANYSVRQAWTDHHLGEGLLKLHFQTSGEMNIGFKGEERTVLNGSLCGLLLHPLGRTKAETLQPGDRKTAVTLYCKPQFLSEVLELQGSDYDGLFRDFVRERPLNTVFARQALTADMAAAMHALLNSPFKGPLRRIQAETKAMDLVCNLLGQLDPRRLSEWKGERRVSARERSRLQEVRERLERDYAHPPTHPQLARAAGMNQTKLASGFKALFGETILECCVRLRMERARFLLTEMGMSITEASGAVGYDYPGNFTAAFKRHFGYPPKLLRGRSPV